MLTWVLVWIGVSVAVSIGVLIVALVRGRGREARDAARLRDRYWRR